MQRRQNNINNGSMNSSSSSSSSTVALAKLSLLQDSAPRKILPPSVPPPKNPPNPPKNPPFKNPPVSSAASLTDSDGQTPSSSASSDDGSASPQSPRQPPKSGLNNKLPVNPPAFPQVKLRPVSASSSSSRRLSSRLERIPETEDPSATASLSSFSLSSFSSSLSPLTPPESDGDNVSNGSGSSGSGSNRTYISVYNGTSSVSTPTSNAAGVAGAPPQPPTTTPRNVRDALNILSNRNSDPASAATAAATGTPMKSNNGSAPAYEQDSNRKHYNDNKFSGQASSAKIPPETREKPEVQAAPPPPPARKPRQLDGYVGFANLPNQVYRKAVKKGFEFTLMVAGESGLGKSTLINSMFLTDIYSAEYPGPSARIKKTVKVDTNKVLLKESGVNLTLTVVDTPGFGDAVDNSDCWEPVIRYVESQYEEFLDAETRVHRVSLPDTRVHACLYFIAPSGHGLKPLDIEFMQRLHDKVNIIPVIAKSDTMTPEEITHFKKQIMNQIVQSKINIYEFPDADDTTEEEHERKEIQKLKERVPFAVVGSNTVIERDDGKKTRGRKYPWGVVDIENLDHCDFIPLRNMLIRTNLQDLKDVTNNVHYENYRCRKLAGVAGGTVDKIPNRNPLAQIEEERREHHSKLLKMEKEMEEVFERKVREKKQKLHDSEADLEKRHRESKDKLEQQKRDLESKMAAFQQEREQWERMNNVTIDELKRLSMESLDGAGGGKNKKKGGLSGVSFRMGR